MCASKLCFSPRGCSGSLIKPQFSVGVMLHYSSYFHSAPSRGDLCSQDRFSLQRCVGQASPPSPGIPDASRISGLDFWLESETMSVMVGTPVRGTPDAKGHRRFATPHPVRGHSAIVMCGHQMFSALSSSHMDCTEGPL